MCNKTENTEKFTKYENQSKAGKGICNKTKRENINCGIL